MTDPIDLTAVEAAAALRRGDLDARELFAAYRARAAADDTNSFTWLADGAPESVPGAETVLAGLPIAVKDLFCIEGVPTASCSNLLRGYRPPYTATAIERLQGAGATVLGKTNQDEFAMGSSNENSAFGAVRNPWDRTRVPGGSSGGSAAAVAAGLAPAAIGTDTGGSVRQPAALCGVVGLKPTYGTVSRYGMIAFASSLDQAGPIGRTVADTALLLQQMVGAGGQAGSATVDPRDATSIGWQGADALGIPSADRLDGVRIGVPTELLADGVEPGVRAAFDASLRHAEALGATVTEVTLPHARHALAAYYVIAPAEASSNLSRFDGVRYGNRVQAQGDGLVDLYTKTRHDGFGPEVKRRIMLGTFALSSGYYDAYYGRAQQVRTKIVEDYRAAFEDVDLIATPTSPSVAWELGALTDDPVAMYAQDVMTLPVSLAGIPAISIPAGLADGLPVGLQLAGPAFSEPRILDAAHALEQAIGFDGSAPRATVTASGEQAR
ncbi:Asp-tRNA(Asn)/Glu-tRNA(Gln) amidotransferase subunit GatA [Patulibacter brassicae]|uniref:Glutamyl-tRNA(Gln) amidotransferase subunit A n=1 Tax=Patulibacter brassicae TaxID=1705717 RepID=A0ABU4VEY6_9ACTN|nr:Asp-tRNA(Asn)/Glu-tRNA(Gln) amidotransferase subunit GatA [Patulibacter brassicae]MDX8150337.1 Asp-tRNA(Asn)/Glu-tRNA(Gln) amidotransferase subunit GatA [Patulibacter brassicae]